MTILTTQSFEQANSLSWSSCKKFSGLHAAEYVFKTKYGEKIQLIQYG